MMQMLQRVSPRPPESSSQIGLEIRLLLLLLLLLLMLLLQIYLSAFSAISLLLLCEIHLSTWNIHRYFWGNLLANSDIDLV